MFSIAVKENNILVSIIIPALNEACYISECIKSIKSCGFPEEMFEIILVDNGSSDSTVNIAQSFGVKTIIDKKKSIGALRNLGCIFARGNIYGFLDADCTVEKGWIQNVIKVLKDKRIGITGSRLRVPENGKWIEKVWGAHLLLNGLHDGYVKYINSGNCFIPKKVFEEVGGFSETLETSEDTDICERITAQGYRIYQSGKISAIHWGYAKSLKGFLKREIWHGKGNTIRNIKIFWRSKSLLIALFNILILFLGLLLLLINYRAGVILFIIFFLFPLLMAIKTSAKANKFNYIFPLFILYILYGIARSVSFLIVIKGYIKGYNG